MRNLHVHRRLALCAVGLGVMLNYGPPWSPTAYAAPPSSSAVNPFHTVLCDHLGALTRVDPNAVSIPSTTTDGKPVQQLVIDYISGSCSVSQVNQRVISVDLSTVGSSNSDIHSYFPTPLGGNLEGVSQPVTLYGDPGGSLTLSIGLTTSGASDAECGLSITGHLVIG